MAGKGGNTQPRPLSPAGPCARLSLPHFLALHASLSSPFPVTRSLPVHLGSLSPLQKGGKAALPPQSLLAGGG